MKMISTGVASFLKYGSKNSKTILIWSIIFFGVMRPGSDRNGVVNRHNCTYWSSENPHIKTEVPYAQEGLMV